MESIDAPNKAVPNERRKEGSIPLHTAIDAPRGSQRRTPKTTPELHEDVQREQGAHEQVRHVHDLADAQIHRDAA